METHVHLNDLDPTLKGNFKLQGNIFIKAYSPSKREKERTSGCFLSKSERRMTNLEKIKICSLSKFRSKGGRKGDGDKELRLIELLAFKGQERK